MRTTLVLLTYLLLVAAAFKWLGLIGGISLLLLLVLVVVGLRAVALESRNKDGSVPKYWGKNNKK